MPQPINQFVSLLKLSDVVAIVFASILVLCIGSATFVLGVKPRNDPDASPVKVFLDVVGLFSGSFKAWIIIIGVFLLILLIYTYSLSWFTGQRSLSQSVRTLLIPASSETLGRNVTPGTPPAGYVFKPLTITSVSPTPTIHVPTPVFSSTLTPTGTWTPIAVTPAMDVLTPTLTPVVTSMPTATLTPTATHAPGSTSTAVPTRVPQACTGYVQITEPHPGDIISQDFTIKGSVYLPTGVKKDPPREFGYYVIHYMRLDGESGSVQQWEYLASGTEQVSAGNSDLERFPMSHLTNRRYAKGRYAIRLRLVDNTGNYDDPKVFPDCIVEVTLAPPVPER
jgi:hypothetical protein